MIQFDLQFLLLFTKNLHIYVKIKDYLVPERQLSGVKLNSDAEPSLVVPTNVKDALACVEFSLCDLQMLVFG